jgi:tRNA pseudouridine55 synthase
MLDSDKIYDFTILFGVETDTLDAEGVSIATADVRPTMAAVEAVLAQFTGPIAQVPPSYSALKVDGERAYDLARAGHAVLLASRNVTIYALAAHPTRHSSGSWNRTAEQQPAPHGDPSVRWDDEGGEESTTSSEAPLEEVTLTAHVSKGTYIRSLARDIAIALGTVGHVTMLRRTKAGPFGLQNAISLDKLDELGQARALEDVLLPLRVALDDIPALSLTPDQAGALRQGRILAGIAADDGQYFAELDAVPVALVEVEDGDVRVVRGFNM